MTLATPPVLYISADTSDLTTRFKATSLMHPGADAWIPRDAVRVKPLEWEDQPGGSYCWVQGLHYYVEGSDEDRDWYWSCMIGDDDVWQGENQTTRDKCKELAQADFEARIMSALAALPAPDEGEQEEGEGE